ncbi:MAG: nucleotidyltransferase domain-containing protein [Deltaproteobacteria bacterium CG_4_10_14_0_2_um_filter_43_8]|nr:MAG: nucleotidyltransferase [Deltaproteobacteria bacterium CG11_big_fil_rev_8_21_14_0_20_42_23]PJA21624.1 MAG: nucleotidyltransferase domain-containing protein [Deltaproteobacteria bacterium CG_4_10_14_0_2_um_filter_43_8]PJC65266.1 MAG: nucleotidyltransferase domain-containing protein [Deltaproteobacteria bacterium CG_4_9_14_0_2_um_filter_42_21]
MVPSEREKEILRQSVELLIQECLPEKIYFFGSRAKGEGSATSDFDLALEATPPSEKKVRVLKAKLDALSGLYSVDVIFLSQVDPEFLQLILETGRIVYDKKRGLLLV